MSSRRKPAAGLSLAGAPQITAPGAPLDPAQPTHHPTPSTAPPAAAWQDTDEMLAAMPDPAPRRQANRKMNLYIPEYQADLIDDIADKASYLLKVKKYEVHAVILDLGLGSSVGDIFAEVRARYVPDRPARRP